MPIRFLHSRRLLALLLLGAMSLIPLYARAQNDSCIAAINAPNGTINLRLGPGTTYAVLNTFATGDMVTVLARVDNSWSQVRMNISGSIFEGFLPDGVLTLGMNCAGLPTLPAASFGQLGTPTPIGEFLPTIAPFETMTATPIPFGQCLASASDNVPAYSQADSSSPLIGTLNPGQTYFVFVQDGNGWYEIYLENIGLAWIRGEAVTLDGTCNLVPLPTATLPGFDLNMTPTPIGELFTATPLFNSLTAVPTVPPPEGFPNEPSLCAVASVMADTTTLHNGPGASFANYAEMQSGVVYLGVTRSDNGWIELATGDRVSRLIGWAGPGTFTTSDACARLPLVTAGDYDVTVWYPEY